MKKLFTMVAMAFMAVCVNAQSITWSKDDVCDKGAAKESYSNGELVLTCTDTDKGKHEVDANNAYFGNADNYVKYEYRFKTGGKSNSKNGLKLTVPSDGKLSMYVRTGSSSATDRNVVLKQNDTELFNKIIKEADAIKVGNDDDKKSVYPVYTVDVKAGDISIEYPVNSMYFYAFEFTATGGTDGINSAKVTSADSKTYDLGGRVASKGLVIKNGKKYVK